MNKLISKAGVILVVILGGFLLISCVPPPTDVEIADMKRICEINNEVLYIGKQNYTMYCMPNPVQACIIDYHTSLEKKYNNPDTVSNLSEDTFSDALKACHEVYGTKKTKVE